MAFYKYRSFNDDHISAIVNNEIWFARGDTFNDPFDSKSPLSVLTYESVVEVIRKRPNANKLTTTQIHNLAEQWLDETHTMKANQTLEKHPIWPYLSFTRQRAARRFILCLTQSNVNVLMWSHYSKSHTGFCVRYNLDVLLSSLKIEHHDSVTYSNEIPDVLSSMMDDEIKDLSNDLVFQKARDWEYEKEYRLILDEIAEDEYDKYREMRIPENAIDRIYFGIESTKTDQESLRDRLSGREIDFYQMVRAQRAIGVFAKKI
jgi:hypothetical protein